jgi:hypothetical protein
MSPGSHNEVMATVLSELPGGEGIVRRDDGEIVLAHDVTLDWGQPLQPWDGYQPIRIGLSDDRMLFGGLLPAGAVSVEAVEATGVRNAAAVGGGTHAVVFEDREHSEPPWATATRRARSSTGRCPPNTPHQPVSDAEEPCPVCGAVQYDEYFPTEDRRAGRGTKGTDTFLPSPLVVCRVCGHQEQAGGIVRFRQADSADEDEVTRPARVARIRAEQTAQRWYSNTSTLMAVTFPIYAAEGWPARINVCRHRQPRDGPGVQADPIGDTLNLIDPDTLPRRLEAAGMVGPQVKVGGRSFRWRAAKLQANAGLWLRGCVSATSIAKVRASASDF